MASIEFDLIADLEARNLIHDSTDREFLRAHVAAGPVGIYYGCDPTADSLHVGNLIGLVTLRRFQDAGHRPIALAGGATGMVGDPSGRSEERNLLDDNVLDHNVACIKEQLGRIVDLGPQESVPQESVPQESVPRESVRSEAGRGRGELVDNRTWTQPISVLEFLRDVGKHVTVNQMLARESIKMRINSEHGISFTEFSYMLLQANDYLWLHDNLGCTIQIGGSDQWGNIIAGVDLIRRKTGKHVHAFSWPLLTASDGSKLGKTTGARVWLDAEKTSPYQFRQHWMQIADDDIEAQLLTFSLRPVDELRALVTRHAEAPQHRLAQRELADEMVTLVHGADAAHAATEAADLLFSADPVAASASALEALSAEIPSSSVDAAGLGDLVVTLVATGLASSNGDARRNLAQGSYYVNGVTIDENSVPTEWERLQGRYVLLRKGKKTHHLLEISS